MLTAYLGVLFCVIVWGSNFVAGGWLVLHLSPILIAATRLIISSCFLVILGIIIHRFTKLKKRQLYLLLLSGVIGTLLNQIGFFKALQYTTPTESSLIMSLSPIATAILSFLILKEKITIRMAVGSIVAILGVFLLVSQGAHMQISLGDTYAVLAMVSFSANIVIIRKIAASLNWFTVTMYSTIIGTGLFVPTSIVSDGLPHYSHQTVFWVVLILSAVLSQGVCAIFSNFAITKIGATQVAIIIDLQPFVTMIVGYLALGIPVTVIQVIGGIVIIFGVVLATLRLPQKYIPAFYHMKSTKF